MEKPKQLDQAIFDLEDTYISTELDRYKGFLEAAHLAKGYFEEDSGHDPLTVNITHQGGSFEADLLIHIPLLMFRLSQHVRRRLEQMGQMGTVELIDRYVGTKFGKEQDGTG